MFMRFIEKNIGRSELYGIKFYFFSWRKRCHLCHVSAICIFFCEWCVSSKKAHSVKLNFVTHNFVSSMFKWDLLVSKTQRRQQPNHDNNSSNKRIALNACGIIHFRANTVLWRYNACITHTAHTYTTYIREMNLWIFYCS